MALENLEPRSAFAFFEEMCGIPHGSGNEKAISDYLMDFAEKRGLKATRDEFLNVLIKKGGSSGYESAAPVILQGHIDMVCEKNAGCAHDFTKDPLTLRVNGDFIKAEGTTLGADNCAAVAIALAVLDAADIPHPPLELVCTTREEVGLEGAAAFDCGQLAGKRFINLDSEEEGVITVGCAGGMRATMTVPLEFRRVPGGCVSFSAGVSGLRGGHSGMDIHRELANANILLARMLNKLNREHTIYISGVSGGAQDNAIPREARAVVSVRESDAQSARDIARVCESEFRREFQTRESGLTISFEKLAVTEDNAFTAETAGKYLAALLLCPGGVLAMSQDIEGLVETSNNVGVVRTENGCLSVTCALRSSTAGGKRFLLERIELLAERLGAAVGTHGDYPAWEYKRVSPLRDTLTAVYKDMFNKEPVTTAVHAGLECGLFAEKIKDADMVSFGPDITGAHSPDERLSVSSFQRTWEFLLAVLKRLCKR